MKQVLDGGYIVAGRSDSTDGDVTGNHGAMDAWAVKISSGGVLQWQKCFGGSVSDWGNSVWATSDGGCVLAGGFMSDDGNVTGHHASTDFGIVKLSAAGAMQWQQCFGGTKVESATAVLQSADGGYLLAGISGSDDYDVSNNKGSWDFWVIKLAAPSDVNTVVSTGDIEIFPNPTNDHIYTSVGKDVSMEVYNSLGQIVKQTEDNNISVAELSAGVYFITILDSQKRLLKHEKFIKIQ
ncbi:MAG: T9SS type A sorting domain-containing protein [Bacteroidota bacterium]